MSKPKKTYTTPSLDDYGTIEDIQPKQPADEKD